MPLWIYLMFGVCLMLIIFSQGSIILRLQFFIT